MDIKRRKFILSFALTPPPRSRECFTSGCVHYWINKVGLMIPALLASVSICYVGRSQAWFYTIVHHQEHFVFIEVMIDELGGVG